MGSIDLKYLLLVINLYLVVFNNSIINLGFWDELFAIVILCYSILQIIYNRFKINISVNTFIQIISIVLIIIIGIGSNIQHKFQSFSPILLDVIVTLKFPITFFGSLLLFKNYKFGNKMKQFYFHVRIITTTIFVLALIDCIFGIYHGDISNYGIRQIQLFYGHPTFLAAISVLLLCLNLSFLKTNKKAIVYICMCVFTSLVTLRMKVIIFILLFWFIYFVAIKLSKKIKIRQFLVFIPFSVYIAMDKIVFYFLNDRTDIARTALMKTSFKIAKDFFPLGSGFATFGSYYSGQINNYSPIYDMYGISNVYGLSKHYNSFIADSFWPMILSQFGFLGIMLYLIFLLFIFKKISKTYYNNQQCYYVTFLLLSYLVISSTSESAFNNSFAVSFALYLSIFIAYGLRKCKEVNNGEKE